MSSFSYERWSWLWREAAGRGDGRAWFDLLSAGYAEPNRYYHNARHIVECLDEFDAARRFAKQPIAVEFAVWFHDAIYNTLAPDNEEQSAALAERCLEDARVSKDLRLAVRDLVLATKTHDGSMHPDAPLLVDVDLSILGKDEARFVEYEEEIRQEYAAVPEALFAQKRADILEDFLVRESIYSTDMFVKKFEKQARANLRASIKRLRK
jgi:predicted metal-dependent HD superfamily phosphohydrolase